MKKHDDIEFYGEKGISSADAAVPRWLKWSYLVLVIWGFFWLYFYWNGTEGWLDRGYWFQLEKAANTTFPILNQNEPGLLKESRENQEES